MCLMVLINFLQNSPQGSVLLGAISYGKLSYLEEEERKNPQDNPVPYQISYMVPPNKVVHDVFDGSYIC